MCLPKVFIDRLELHKGDGEEYAVSFIYDKAGEDGDIIETGTHKDMKKLYDKWKDKLVGVEYFDALNMMGV